jgi:hypothetical protein
MHSRQAPTPTNSPYPAHTATAARPRTFNVFLPHAFDAALTYPIWMHMHGVYWASMDNVRAQVSNHLFPSTSRLRC